MGRGRPVGLTRREVLLGGLGAVASAGLAWKLYRPTAPRGRILGEIVGASHVPGHRLREGRFPEPSSTESVGVAIVGGGVAGLSAAWRLAKRGRTDFRVFELEPREGGTSAWGANGTTMYPWGAHYLPVPGPEAVWVRELLAEMGVIEGTDPDGEPVFGEMHLVADPEERLFLDGEWREGLFPGHGASAEDLAQAARFRDEMTRYRSIRGADGRRAFAIPVESSSRDEGLLALDRMTMAAHLESLGITSPRVRWWVEYGCRDDFGCSLATTSAWAGIHYFASRPEEGALLAWPEGNGRLVRAMMERIGPRVETGKLAVRVVPEDRRVVIDLWEPRSDRVTRIVAEHAVLAVPQFVAARVVEPWRAAVPEWVRSFTYAPWMVANVHVERLPEGAGFETAWDNVLYDSEGLGYVVATHQQPRAWAGPSVLTYYRPFVGPDPAAERGRMLGLRWEEWRDLILADLTAAHPSIEEVVRRVDVMLWAHGMVRPTPGFLWGGHRALASRPLGRLHLAHSDLSGLALFEEAQYWGVRAAEEILG